MWKDMEECQNKLSLIGTETLTDSNAQLSLLIMQVKCLTAELSQWQKKTPEIIPLTEDVLITLGKEEFQKLRQDLEMVLSTMESKNEKLKEDLERIFNELKTKMLNVKEYKEKLLSTLGKFLEDHFPMPDRSKNIQESTVQLITLHEMLEVSVFDSFGHLMLSCLLLNGIALRHPEDPTRIRLEAFHA
uniref:Centromere protein K n=1 Tax=Rhinopithecus bieti TaxID=61621 RepID=A0A2K6LDM6_RHIBE